jgi:uncharacterized membrane protein HdeD (DUF308 family)
MQFNSFKLFNYMECAGLCFGPHVPINQLFPFYILEGIVSSLKGEVSSLSVLLCFSVVLPFQHLIFCIWFTARRIERIVASTRTRQMASHQWYMVKLVP